MNAAQQWHTEHANEFRLQCMIGQQKGYARFAANKEDKQLQLYHLKRAEYLTEQLNIILKEKQA